VGSSDLTGLAIEEESGVGARTTSDLGAGATSGAGSNAGCDASVDEASSGCSAPDNETVAGGSGTVIEGPDSLDGPVGSGIDSAASRAGDSATGLGIMCSGPEAPASSRRDSVDDLEGVPGLARPLRAVDDRRIIVPMRVRIDFAEGDPWPWG
jgi:hypothetical protein